MKICDKKNSSEVWRNKDKNTSKFCRIFYQNKYDNVMDKK